MAKRIKEVILQTENDFQVLQQKLESAKATRDEYNRLLKNARDRLARREKSTYPDNLATSFIESLKKGNIPEAILIGEIDNATKTNIEFDNRTYKLYLYKVANDKSIYKFLKTGSGWGTNLDLQIIFEAIAGGLNDWAEGIENYRQVVLKTKGLTSEVAGRRATDWWYDNVYGYELHDKTISGRLAVTPFGVAPFWQILNNGSSPLASDRPGGSNPVPSRPTDFIGKAERAVEKQFLDFMNVEAQKWFDDKKKIQEIINDHEEKRDQYSEEVNRLKTDVRLNEKIYKSFGDKQQYLDRDILAKAIASMDNEERFKKRTINIAKKGSGLDLLITVRKTEGIIEY